MDWILFGIVTLLILSIIWFFIEHKRDFRKNQDFFDEYLENQRKLKFNSRARENRYAMKGSKLIK